MNMVNFPDGIINDLFSIIAKEISKRPLVRKKLLIILSVIDLVVITILIVISLLDYTFKEAVFNVSLGFAFLLTIGLFIVIYSYSPNIKNMTSVSERLSEIENEREVIENRIKENTGGNVQEIIKLNLNQLDEYYTINKSQCKSAYASSVFMIIIGFLLIVASILFYYINLEKYTISIIIGLSGLISEFIGATSLLLYKESSKHLNEFIERLTYLQKVMLAVDLTEKLSDDKKNEQISNIITGLMKLG